MSFLLGLTGSIGMGKSTTARMFADEGVPVWDADAAVHRLYEKDGAAVPVIAAEWPGAVKEGAVDRKALSAEVAGRPEALSRLEALVHPLVADDRARFIAGHAAPVLLFDIPLLYETGADAWLDAVVVVTAPAEVQRARVLARGTMDAAQFEQIKARQMPDAEKRARADFIIETDTLEHAQAQVAAIVDKIRQGQRDA